MLYFRLVEEKEKHLTTEGQADILRRHLEDKEIVSMLPMYIYLYCVQSVSVY